MQAAIEGLRTLGLVRVVPGVGTWVASPRHDTSLMGHAWRSASPAELAGLRRRIDAWAGPALAAQIAALRPGQPPPRTLSDINFLVHERSTRRTGYPELFLRADVTFHRAVVASVEGMELVPTLYEQIATALRPTLMPSALEQAGDHELDRCHLGLVAAILNGAVDEAARLGDEIANRESHTDE